MTAAAPLHDLFLCTHNAARRLLAEALLNAMDGDRLKAYSTGSSPCENQSPYRMRLPVLQAADFSTEGLCSKSWDEFAAPGAPQIDLIITICDSAAGDLCPVWPGHSATAHWGYPDPSEGKASDQPASQQARKVGFAGGRSRPRFAMRGCHERNVKPLPGKWRVRPRAYSSATSPGGENSHFRSGGTYGLV